MGRPSNAWRRVDEPDDDPYWVELAVKDYMMDRVERYGFESRNPRIYGNDGLECRIGVYYRRRLASIAKKYGVTVQAVRGRLGLEELPMYLGRAGLIDRYVALRLDGRIKI